MNEISENKTIIISCELFKTELTLAMKKTGCNYKVIYLPQELHNCPLKLREKIQEELNKLDDVHRVILTVGDCGGATEGLKTGNFELVMPKVEDCITLLLGSSEKRKEVSREGCYFLTESWAKGTRSIISEYGYCLKKYGEETTNEIMREMFNNYKELGLISTEASDYEYLKENTKQISESLSLKQKKIEGTGNYIEKLLTGPYDDEHFRIIKPFGIS